MLCMTCDQAASFLTPSTKGTPTLSMRRLTVRRSCASLSLPTNDPRLHEGNSSCVGLSVESRGVRAVGVHHVDLDVAVPVELKATFVPSGDHAGKRSPHSRHSAQEDYRRSRSQRARNSQAATGRGARAGVSAGRSGRDHRLVGLGRDRVWTWGHLTAAELGPCHDDRIGRWRTLRGES